MKSSNHPSRRGFLRTSLLSLCALVAPSLLLSSESGSSARAADRSSAGVPSRTTGDTTGDTTGGTTGGRATAGARLPTPATAPLRAKRWGMVIDTRALDPGTLAAMIAACHAFHNVPAAPAFAGSAPASCPSSNAAMGAAVDIAAGPVVARAGASTLSARGERGDVFSISAPLQEVKWIWQDIHPAVFPDQADPYPPQSLRDRAFPLLCNHCANPPCTRVCPTGATFRQEGGIVAMDYHRCIGCRYCMAACPYGARSFNFRDPAPLLREKNADYPARMRGVVEKCAFCTERLAVGNIPLCVEVAGGRLDAATGKISGGAVAFGDLADPDSAPRKLLAAHRAVRRKPHLGTEPSVFYIV